MKILKELKELHRENEFLVDSNEVRYKQPLYVATLEINTGFGAPPSKVNRTRHRIFHLNPTPHAFIVKGRRTAIRKMIREDMDLFPPYNFLRETHNIAYFVYTVEFYHLKE